MCTAVSVLSLSGCYQHQSTAPPREHWPNECRPEDCYLLLPSHRSGCSHRAGQWGLRVSFFPHRTILIRDTTKQTVLGLNEDPLNKTRQVQRPMGWESSTDKGSLQRASLSLEVVASTLKQIPSALILLVQHCRHEWCLTNNMKQVLALKHLESKI